MRAWRSVISTLGSAVLALFLAAIIWVVAVYERNPPRTDVLPNTIPISVLDLGNGLVIANQLPSTARVQVRALSDAWDTLKPTDFEATIDLLGHGSGRYQLPVVVTTLVPHVSIGAIEPATVEVVIEELAERKLQVRVRTVDEESIPLGYMSLEPVVSPDQVTVSGPKNLVERVAEAVIEVSLRDARDTVTRQDAPQLLDSSGRRVEGVTLAPTLVRVSIDIQRQGGYRDLAVRATTSGSPAPGYWISAISVEPVLVTVWGKQEIIDALPGYLDTQPVDVENATGDVVQRVALALPQGVVPLGAGSTAEGILVQINIQPQLGGKTINSAVEIIGLRTGLSAKTSPPYLDVILSGPLPALQDLDPDDVRITVDLTGLARGSHRVTPTVTIPQGLGLAVKGTVPDIVEVTIE